MLKQFNRFLLLAIIVAAALYITLTNSDSATLKLGPRLTLSTYAGVIYIGIFAAGCIAASLVALFFGLKSYLRERRLLSLERNRQNFFKSQEKARGLMAAGDWGAARSLWEDVINRDPENIVAKVELSKCVEELGDVRESLRVLDSTRASSRASIEVLFRAAQLNQRLGNNTAARDNLALILAMGPSHKALELARDTSEALGQFDAALQFQQELETIGYTSEQDKPIRARLAFKQIPHDSATSEIRRNALLAFIKRHPEFSPALESLADIERAKGNIDACAEYLVKAARSSGGDISRWRRVVDLWRESGAGDQRQRADRAVAAARSATKDTKGKDRLEAELLMIETLLAFNHFQDAERALEGFAGLAQRENAELTTEISQRLTTLKGYCLAQTGNVHSTGPLWQQLALPGSSPANNRSDKAQAARIEPSPVLSTP
jgi:thioredoxin-like negative regulator of GroEL